MSDNPDAPRITDVLQIISATDWWFFDPYLSDYRDKRALVPVVCFALVESKIPGYEDQPMKHTIALAMENFRDLPGLIGMDVGRREREVFHVTELERINYQEDPLLELHFGVDAATDTKN